MLKNLNFREVYTVYTVGVKINRYIEISVCKRTVQLLFRLEIVFMIFLMGFLD